MLYSFGISSKYTDIILRFSWNVKELFSIFIYLQYTIIIQ